MDLAGFYWGIPATVVLTVLVVIVLGVVKNRVDQFRVEKRFPVAGEYLTSYETDADGRLVWRSAPAALKQKGSRIFGYTKRPESDREWYLEGQISKAGHIYGMYYGLDPHDKSMGSFFLLTEDNGSLEGLWSGYGKVGSKLVSGRYLFNPMGTEVRLKELDEDYIPSIVALADELLGKDYLTKQEFQLALQKDERYIAKVALNSKNEVVGFYIGIRMAPEEIKAHLRIPSEDYPQALNYAKSVGLIKIVAVREDHQRRGIGSKLTEDCTREFAAHQVTALCCIGWRSNKGINIGGILKNQDFREFKEMPNYWKEDSLLKNYHCSDCGPPPCRCSAMVYVKYR